MSTTPFDWETIARYLAGECPAEDAEAIRRWMDAHPNDAALVRALHATADRAAAAPSSATMTIDVDAAWQRVAAQTSAAQTSAAQTSAAQTSPDPAVVVLSRWRRPVVRAAAALLVVAIGALRWLSTRDADATARRQYATTVGQRDSVRLPDGSTVLLAPNSRLDVSDDYGDARRDVTLVGEAFFDVRHDSARPFVVHAAGALVRDVGTTFTVRTDAPAVAGDDSTVARVRVAVRSGAAELSASDVAGAASNAGSTALLRAGDVGAVTAAGRVIARPGASTDDDVAWTRGRLVFRHASLDVVRAELRRWYGVELRVADTVVAGRHLVATFSGEPLDGVLRVIGLALGARVEREGGIVTLSHVTPRQ